MYFSDSVDIIVGIVSLGFFAIVFVCYPTTCRFARYPTIRDFLPYTLIAQHIAAALYTAHYAIAWKHSLPLCIPLAIVQFFASALFFGLFTVKIYLMHYRDSRQAASPVMVFIISSFPFVIIATARVALRTQDQCPLMDIANGVVALVLLAVLRFRYWVEHPSPYFRLAPQVELASVFWAATVCIVRQFTREDVALIICTLTFSIFANAAFLCYLIPPLWDKVKRRDEYTLGALPMANDSIANETDWLSSALHKMPSFGLGSSTPAQSTTFVPPPKRTGDLRKLISQIEDGDFDSVQIMLSRGQLTVLNEQDAMGCTALHHAVRRGDLRIIRFLIEMGADMYRTNIEGLAPIHEAVRSNRRAALNDRSNIISELAQIGGVMINAMTSSGLTPLHYAVKEDSLGALHTLLRYGANPLCGDDSEDAEALWTTVHFGVYEKARKSPLMLAVEMGLDKHVSSMIMSIRSSNPKHIFDRRCPHGLTFLHVALSLGHQSVTGVLLKEARCSPSAINDGTRQNVFHFAALGGSCEALLCLVDAMDAPDILPWKIRCGEADKAQRSPSLKRPPSYSDVSASGNLFPKVLTIGTALQVLQRNLPQFSMESDRGATESQVDRAVFQLRSRGRDGEASLLEQALLVLRRFEVSKPGSSSSRMDFHTPSPSSCAEYGGDEPLLRITELINDVDSNWFTPLHYAVRSGNLRMCSIFAHYGAVLHDPPGSGDETSPGQTEGQRTAGSVIPLCNFTRTEHQKKPELASHIIAAMKQGAADFRKYTTRARTEGPPGMTVSPMPSSQKTLW